jgi:16S rRNA (guanine527-N7)-methyltransferase
LNKNLKNLALWSEKLGAILSQTKLNQFQIYHEFLLNWNQKINLVSRKDIDRIVSYHFIDSISAITEIPANSTVCDLGTGAGLPGIPVKIARDDITLYLIESIRKKSVFLTHVIDTLKLDKAFLINERAEIIKDKKFDIILIRLFGKIPDVLPLAVNLLHKNGKIVFYKISGVETEIDKAKKIARKNHLQLETVKDVKLPVTGISRKLVIYTTTEKN